MCNSQHVTDYSLVDPGTGLQHPPFKHVMLPRVHMTFLNKQFGHILLIIYTDLKLWEVSPMFKSQ